MAQVHMELDTDIPLCHNHPTMGFWDVCLGIFEVGAKALPWDRYLAPKDPYKKLEEFAQGLPSQAAAEETTRATAILARGGQVESPPGPASTYDLPTRAETTTELKRRLAKELYRAELDLSNKLRIAGKPCDCLDAKHSLGLEAAAEELIAEEPDNPVYDEIIGWIKGSIHKCTIEAIASGAYDDEYPRMALEFKEFRKRVLGTTALRAMVAPEPQITLEEAQKLAAEEAANEVKKRWHSQERK